MTDIELWQLEIERWRRASAIWEKTFGANEP